MFTLRIFVLLSTEKKAETILLKVLKIMDIKICNMRLQKGLLDLKIYIIISTNIVICKTCFPDDNLLNTKEKYKEH